jgi:hypothetical protein
VVDIAAIAGLTTSFRSILEITKAMKGIHDASLIQTKVFELTREILAAQSYAMDAVAAQSALLERVGKLEAEKAELETWNAQKDRYQLKTLPPGVFVYSLKEGMEQGEPAHSICAKCYEHRKRSILHSSGREQDLETFTCHECSTKYYVVWNKYRELDHEDRI